MTFLILTILPLKTAGSCNAYKNPSGAAPRFLPWGLAVPRLMGAGTPWVWGCIVVLATGSCEEPGPRVRTGVRVFLGKLRAEVFKGNYSREENVPVPVTTIFDLLIRQVLAIYLKSEKYMTDSITIRRQRKTNRNSLNQS